MFYWTLQLLSAAVLTTGVGQGCTGVVPAGYLEGGIPGTNQLQDQSQDQYSTIFLD